MANISKKDSIKTAIMTFLNKKVGSLTRPEIDKEVKKLGSTRTITRALAELKTEGKVIFAKGEGNSTNLWTSTEAKKDTKKTSTKKSSNKNTRKKTGTKKDTKNADKKNTAGTPDKEKTPDKDKLTKDQLKKAAEKGKTAAKSPATDKPEKTKSPKKVGVIATIIKAISKKPKTKKQILARLVKRFPDREEAKMMKTINVQVPSRLRKDKELNIQKTDKGYIIKNGKWKAPKK